MTITGLVKTLGQGKFNEAYLVEGTGLVDESGRDINLFVLKIPDGDQRKSPNANILHILSNEVRQYQTLKTLFEDKEEVRIASYYDLDGFDGGAGELTHGCHLVEYIEGEPYPIPQHETEVQEDDAKLKAILGYLSAESEIDLTFDNMVMDDLGKGVLVDPMHPEGQLFQWICKRSLESFAPPGSARYNDLASAITFPIPGHEDAVTLSNAL